MLLTILALAASPITATPATPPDSRPAHADDAQVRAWANEEADKRSYRASDRITAGLADSLLGRFITDVGQTDPGYDSAWMAEHRGKWSEVESFGQDQQEVDLIREATSQKQLSMIQTEILERRQRNKIIDSSDMGWAVRLGSNAIPVLPLMLGIAAWRRRRKPMIPVV